VSPIRVLVADDHPFFRDGLRVLLETTPDTELAGEVADGQQAIALAAQVCPDVILMDLRMPGTGGVEATRRILAAQPDAAVLVVTMVEDDDAVFAAMRAGARGYLLKGADKEETLAAMCPPCRVAQPRARPSRSSPSGKARSWR
jgi:DNA-binding NarL/FixJ family response regulator